MADEMSDPRMADPREALREALTNRGFKVQSDTLGSRRELYVMGDNDIAIALFEFKSSPREAIDTMYHGAWTPDLPPRFAVLPVSAAQEPGFELLEQMSIIPLPFTTLADDVEFAHLDEILARHLQR
jgi:hypothetical protein